MKFRNCDERTLGKILANYVNMDNTAASDIMRSYEISLPPITDESFGSHFDLLGSSRTVLLGDASHGTSESYQARAALTKYLVEKHGFTTIALEADWPDAEALD